MNMIIGVIIKVVGTAIPMLIQSAIIVLSESTALKTQCILLIIAICTCNFYPGLILWYQ